MEILVKENKELHNSCQSTRRKIGKCTEDIAIYSRNIQNIETWKNYFVELLTEKRK